jgi:deoxycytidine triphosphate deaminase
MFLADTLIRAFLHLEPDTLSDEEWGHQVQMAEWVKNEIASSLWRTR